MGATESGGGQLISAMLIWKLWARRWRGCCWTGRGAAQCRRFDINSGENSNVNSGTLGAAMARVLLDRTGCAEPLARGVAAASAAHGMATAALGTAEPEVGSCGSQATVAYRPARNLLAVCMAWYGCCCAGNRTSPCVHKAG